MAFRTGKKQRPRIRPDAYDYQWGRMPIVDALASAYGLLLGLMRRELTRLPKHDPTTCNACRSILRRTTDDM